MSKNRLLSNLIIFAILISVFTDCKNSSTSGPEPSEGPQILIGQKIELSDTYSAIDLEVVDSLLIVLCNGDEYKFHVYNKNTFKLIGKFGQEGRAPSEYMAPLIMSQKLRIRDSAYLIVYDLTLRRINFVNILKAINNINYSTKSINSRDRMIPQLYLIRSAVISGDSLIVGTAGDFYNNDGRFFCYNILNDKMSWEPFYPVPKIPPHVSRKPDMYSDVLALRPDGKDIASATSYFERIDILDYRGKLKRSVIFENQDKQDFSIPKISSAQEGAHYYFTSISVSQDYIYALDYDRVIGDPERIDTATLVKIAWDEIGLPPEFFKITPLTFKIEVDEEQNRIFGIESFSSFIYIYEMGKSLTNKK